MARSIFWRMPRSSDCAVSAPMLSQILLMIFLGAIKLRRRLDLGHDRTTKTSALAQFFSLLFGHRFLRRRKIEDNRAILRTEVRPLTIWRGRIVVAPKSIE